MKMRQRQGLKPFHCVMLCTILLAGIGFGVARAELDGGTRDRTGQSPLPSGQLPTPTAATGSSFAAVNTGGDFAACEKGQVDVAAKATDFHGEEMIKRLILADLDRAKREQYEGDADKCLEALDHARKLIAGDY